jgi:hypothetical protein
MSRGFHLDEATEMRTAIIGFIGGVALAAAASANAAPSVPAPVSQQNIIAVAGGCGPGFHPNRWGRCVPHRSSYYRADPRWGYYGGGDGYGPMNRPSPSDHIARELNRRQLYGGGY